MFRFRSLIPIVATIGLCFCVAIVPRPLMAQVNDDNSSKTSDSSPLKTATRDDSKDWAMFDQATQAIDQGRTEMGMALLRQLIELRNDFGNMSALTYQVCYKLSVAYFQQGDYPTAIYLANAMESSKLTRDLTCRLRAVAYQKLQLPSAEIDELRNAIRRNPEDVDNRMNLAFALAQTEVPTMRNGLEALAAVEGLEKTLAQDPLIAKCIATAAAEAGDFPLAVHLQSKFVDVVAEEKKEFESTLLRLYESNTPLPRVTPEFDVNQLARTVELASIASRSMVCVRLRGTTDCTEIKTGTSYSEIVKRDHMGAALNRMGTILVSCETIRPPLIKRLEGKGPEFATSRWSVEPIIEVHSLATDHTTAKLLGKAMIVGVDEATGLAVIQIESQKPLEIFDGLEPIRFQPDYRAIDPKTNVYLAEIFEPRINANKVGDNPSLALVHPHSSNTTTYDDAFKNTNVARLTMIPDSSVEAGTPYFNLIGECVGLSHRVMWDGKSKVVSIPSTVCSRIASKLAAYGKVERAYLPLTVTGVTSQLKNPSNETKEITGMTVTAVPKGVDIYQSLQYKLITEVDGILTPTLTEWLVALERAWSRGVDTIALTVYDDKLGVFSTVYLPTTKAHALEPAPPRVHSETAVAEASKWMESNVHPDIYAKTGITLTRRMQQAIADNRNFSMFFDGYAMSNDLPVALLVRDGELVTQTLDLRATELSGPGRGNISFNPFGKPVMRSDQSLRIVELAADSSRSTEHGEIVLKLNVAGLKAIQGKFALRVQFMYPGKLPCFIPITSVPAPNTTEPFAFTVALAEETVSQNLGDVAVVDIVEVIGDPKVNEYSGVSNQWLGYIELADAETIQQILEIEKNSEQKQPK